MYCDAGAGRVQVHRLAGLTHTRSSHQPRPLRGERRVHRGQRLQLHRVCEFMGILAWIQDFLSWEESGKEEGTSLTYALLRLPCFVSTDSRLHSSQELIQPTPT